jgi:hypothetical protein
MWFKQLCGFEEESPAQVREQLMIRGNKLISVVSQREFTYGKLEIPQLDELRKRANPGDYHQRIRISEVVGNVQNFHKDPANRGALFQAASQFNLLEMTGPDVTPEQGVDIYEYDPTQGPACAIACGAGTIYRNYFIPLEGQTGQTAALQIDCLADIGRELGNSGGRLWQMSNGYALANKEGLGIISEKINKLSPAEYEQLKGKLRIGLQTDTEVTISENHQLVSQAYCAALPVAYSDVQPEYWETFARMILEATYEATFYAALANYERNGNNKAFLTLVGGGAFGNKTEWITDALGRTIQKFANTPLDMRMVSYGGSKTAVQELINSL